jgi:branched-chain amino acid transport system substrate-binding protein
MPGNRHRNGARREIEMGQGIFRGRIGFAALASAMLCSAGVVQAEPVKIGMVTTLSTGAGYLGEDVRNGFELALEQAGAADRIELLVEDDGLEPEQGLQIAERMIERDGVKLMTGIIFSNVAMAVVPRVVRQDVIYVSPNAGPSALAGKGCHENYFNAAWQNDNLHEATGAYVKQEGFQNVYLLAPNYPAGKDALTGYKRFYDGGVAGEVYTQLGQTDYAAELATLRAASPDAVFFFYPGGMGINFVKQAAQAGLTETIPFFGPAFSFDDTILDAVGDAAIGIHNGSQWSPDMDNEANQAFVAAYKEKFGRYPTLYSSQGFDTANLILSALDKTGDSLDDPAAFRDALRAADFTSVRGKFSFGPNQHPIQDLYVRVAYKDESGNITNKLVAKVLEDHGDAYAAECKM